jgi:hypothetical protein
VRDLNPSGEHQLGDVTQAYTEAVVESHTPTDDLWREAIAFVERGSFRRLRHGDIRADRERLDNAQPATDVQSRAGKIDGSTWNPYRGSTRRAAVEPRAELTVRI